MGQLFIHAHVAAPVRSLVRIWLLLICGALLSVSAPKPTAEQLFKEGQKAERAGQIAQAYVLYSQAAAADSTNLMYWQRAQALRPIASLLKPETTPAADLAADKIDSTLFGAINDRELEDARKPLPPPRLEALRGARDYDLQGDSKSLWEQVAKTLHLLVVFDTQYQPTRSLRFQLADADYSYALRALEAATDSFIVPVSERRGLEPRLELDQARALAAAPAGPRSCQRRGTERGGPGPRSRDQGSAGREVDP